MKDYIFIFLTKKIYHVKKPISCILKTTSFYIGFYEESRCSAINLIYPWTYRFTSNINDLSLLEKKKKEGESSVVMSIKLEVSLYTGNCAIPSNLSQHWKIIIFSEFWVLRKLIRLNGWIWYLDPSRFFIWMCGWRLGCPVELIETFWHYN